MMEIEILRKIDLGNDLLKKSYYTSMPGYYTSTVPRFWVKVPASLKMKVFPTNTILHSGICKNLTLLKIDVLPRFLLPYLIKYLLIGTAQCKAL